MWKIMRASAIGHPILLMIREKGKEGKNRNVAAHQSAPRTFVHCASCSGCDIILQGRAVFGRLGFGPVEQSTDFSVWGLFNDLYPGIYFFEEVPEHCNSFIKSQLFI